MFGTLVRLTPSTAIPPPGRSCTPTPSSPKPPLWGTCPMVSSTCVPSTVRPSSKWTTPWSPTRSTLAALAFFTVSRSRRRNTSSITRAASSSSEGSTRSRLTTKVTCEPKRRKAVVYSAPVAPAPITTSCSGTSLRLYTSWLDRITSPAGGGAGGDQDGVAGQTVDHRPAVADLDGVGVGDAAGAKDELGALGGQPLADVGRLGVG